MIFYLDHQFDINIGNPNWDGNPVNESDSPVSGNISNTI